jgi:hypothetical protein
MITFTLDVLAGPTDGALTLQATQTITLITATRGVVFSAAVGGPCYLLFICRFDPHVLQVCPRLACPYNTHVN